MRSPVGIPDGNMLGCVAGCVVSCSDGQVVLGSAYGPHDGCLEGSELGSSICDELGVLIGTDDGQLIGIP